MSPFAFLHFDLIAFDFFCAPFRAHMAVGVSFVLLIGYTGKAGVMECYADVGLTDFDE